MQSDFVCLSYRNTESIFPCCEFNKQRKLETLFPTNENVRLQSAEKTCACTLGSMSMSPSFGVAPSLDWQTFHHGALSITICVCFRRRCGTHKDVLMNNRSCVGMRPVLSLSQPFGLMARWVLSCWLVMLQKMVFKKNICGALINICCGQFDK